MDERIFPNISKTSKILDLDCGPGFWVIEFASRGFKNIYAADLTETAIELVKKRAELYSATVETSVSNAEKLKFEDDEFDHVNCQGVIHYSPDTEACIREIHRILKASGTASISVYYKNFRLYISCLIACFPL
ncbi:MAG TPA: hypothetical protein DEG23_01760 [Coxiellaceae bacterium]|nr:hypothetical protein [Coxiellaceae bacterium]